MTNFNKEDLIGLVGRQLVYTFNNGWKYEIYVKNENTVDYRIHSGIVGNRWVKDQGVDIFQVANAVYKLSWTEPTGTDVSLIINLGDQLVHGTIFFPRWVVNNPEKTVCFQNEHLEKIEAYREAGPTYPTEVINQFASIIFSRDCGVNNEEVINCVASELPSNFPENLK
ncbi:phenolic acid decarboxylase [Photobacterium lipolyticum]|uniref:Phenolic acid decarboxylase n=1 Tax=Photobacterium lipolyticum TaxID=266810 RepID=A0A2T3N482_9GAMM|nr:phenolic acid decarboxylase [Photobacterium lipolyticum]PSW07204.1 phenolic acid decarboxylase [Photobacterium lipolyticum]